MGNPLNVLGEFLTYLEYFWHNFWTRNDKNLIKGSKNAYFSLESKKNGIGWWRQIINQKKDPHHEPIGPKTPHPNLKNVFFILNYTEPLVITGFEQLSSSICSRVMGGQIWPERAIMPLLKS